MLRLVLIAVILLAASAADAIMLGHVSGKLTSAEICHVEAPCEAAGVLKSVLSGDELRTGDPGQLMVSFRFDDSVLFMGPRTHLFLTEEVQVEDRPAEELIIVDINEGIVRPVHKTGELPKLYRTATALILSRGTDFIIVHDPEIGQTVTSQ